VRPQHCWCVPPAQTMRHQGPTPAAFARPGLYPADLNPDDRLGLLPLLRDDWGLDPRNDQQFGGLLMWVPGCSVYLSAILATVSRWFGTREESYGVKEETA